jgi:hypothetical protein
MKVVLQIRGVKGPVISAHLCFDYLSKVLEEIMDVGRAKTEEVIRTIKYVVVKKPRCSRKNI